MKMLRKLGIPAMVLAGMLALFTPSHANAKIRFGVQIGGPAYPVYPYPYYDPYYTYPYSYSYGPYVYWGHGHHFHHVDRHHRH